jgi:hypothetical protein
MVAARGRRARRVGLPPAWSRTCCGACAGATSGALAAWPPSWRSWWPGRGSRPRRRGCPGMGRGPWVGRRAEWPRSRAGRRMARGQGKLGPGLRKGRGGRAGRGPETVGRGGGRARRRGSTAARGSSKGGQAGTAAASGQVEGEQVKAAASSQVEGQRVKAAALGRNAAGRSGTTVASGRVKGRRARGATGPPQPGSSGSSGAVEPPYSSTPSAAIPRAFLRMSAICSSIQSPGSRDVRISFSPWARRARSSASIVSAA